MPLFMDVHHGMDASPEELAQAHQKDLEHQQKYDVRFLRYWHDRDQGTVFCLSEAPNAEAAAEVHRAAGHPADEIFRVTEGE